jgi:hypothetical protein
MSYSEATAEVFLTAFHALPPRERELIMANLRSEDKALNRMAGNGKANGHTGHYDEAYLDSLIEKARWSWQSIDDPDRWLRNLRGYKDA